MLTRVSGAKALGWQRWEVTEKRKKKGGVGEGMGGGGGEGSKGLPEVPSWRVTR